VQEVRLKAVNEWSVDAAKQFVESILPDCKLVFDGMFYYLYASSRLAKLGASDGHRKTSFTVTGFGWGSEADVWRDAFVRLGGERE
jgi:hypothetical protein